jgi:hypothetical protein
LIAEQAFRLVRDEGAAQRLRPPSPSSLATAGNSLLFPSRLASPVQGSRSGGEFSGGRRLLAAHADQIAALHVTLDQLALTLAAAD